MSLFLLIVAIILFVVYAFGVNAILGNVGTLGLGLALFAASFLPLSGIAWPNRRG